MQPDLEPSDRATVVRQRVQAVAAVLGVGAIWTLALWPSGPDGAEPQSGPAPRSVASWSTLSPGGPATPGATSTAPTSPIPTETGESSTTVRVGPSAPRRPSSVSTAPTSTTRPATSPSPTSTWMPPGQAKKPTPPPRALDLLGLSSL